MRLPLVALVLGVGLVPMLVAPAQAGGPPTRKAGLWEAKAADQTLTQLCVDAATDAALHPYAALRDPGTCDAPTVKVTGPESLALTLACHSTSRTQAIQAQLTGDFNAHYRLVGTLHSAPRDGQAGDPQDKALDVDVTYRGACPADLAPGQVRFDPGTAKAVVFDTRTDHIVATSATAKLLAAVLAHPPLHHVAAPTPPPVALPPAADEPARPHANLAPGSEVALYAPAQHRFLRMNPNGTIEGGASVVDVTARSPSAAERFYVVAGGGPLGPVALYSPLHQRFVRMTDKGAVDASDPAPPKLPPSWTWERFQVVFLEKGLIAMYNPVVHFFVRVTDKGVCDGSARATADLPADWAWERFQVVVVKPKAKLPTWHAPKPPKAGPGGVR